MKVETISITDKRTAYQQLMNIDGLVDFRSADLWNTLSKEYEINIIAEKRNTYLVRIKKRKATIYIPLENPNSASFAHELLHILMDKEELFISEGLLHVKSDAILSKFLSDKLIDHIANCLEHIKMFPLFLKMGFDREDFISDYAENKLKDEDVKSIKKHFKIKVLFQQEKFNSRAIDTFICSYFAAKACPNPTHNYDNGLNELKRIDTNLYTVLDKFFIAWDKFDYNSSNSITCECHDLLFDFVSDLTEWTKGKILV